MTLRLQPVCVRTGSTDAESQLVFEDGSLVAVLTHLSDEYGDEAGMWFLEVGFGPCASVRTHIFDSLEEAEAWVENRLRTL